MIPCARVTLHFSPPQARGVKTHALRGAIATAFPEFDLLHQHQGEKVVYRYPLIHYRWFRGNGFLMGFHEGASLLINLPLLGRTLHLESREVQVTDLKMNFSSEEITSTAIMATYNFLTPWLPFNQENYARFHQMTTDEQSHECNRIATGNLLTAFRGLGVEYPERLIVSFQPSRKLWCRYKGQDLLGFMGTLQVNAGLPDGLAIGKAVSHGFGWLTPGSAMRAGAKVSPPVNYSLKGAGSSLSDV